MSTEPKKLPIETWLKMLPEPYRSQAIKNHNESNWGTTDGVPSLAEAIGEGFEWSESREGWFYWNDMYDDFKQGKIRPQPDIWLEIQQELYELNEEISKIEEQLNQE